MLSFFPITGSFLRLGLLFDFLLFWCVLSYPFLVESSECLSFATLRRVTDPSSITLSSSFLGTPVPFVPIPHSDMGKLSLLRFLVVGQPFGTLWFRDLALPLLVQVLLLLLLQGTFELSLQFLNFGLESLDSCIMWGWCFPLVLDHHVLVLFAVHVMSWSASIDSPSSYRLNFSFT